MTIQEIIYERGGLFSNASYGGCLARPAGTLDDNLRVYPPFTEFRTVPILEHESKSKKRIGPVAHRIRRPRLLPRDRFSTDNTGTFGRCASVFHTTLFTTNSSNTVKLAWFNFGAKYLTRT